MTYTKKILYDFFTDDVTTCQLGSPLSMPLSNRQTLGPAKTFKLALLKDARERAPTIKNGKRNECN